MPTPETLDDQKRWKIISLLANGCSRRVAARFVGCSPMTITRTAARDPAFADQIAAAEHSAEIDALRLIRAAAKNERYWRAAAWFLERKNPDDYAPRPPFLFTPEQAKRLMAHLAIILNEEIPEENFDRAMKKIEQLLESCREEEIIPPLPNPSPNLQFSPSEPTYPLPHVQHPPSECLKLTNSLPDTTRQS
jgi:hypothetical protein